MARYIAKRLLQAIPAFLIITVIVFLLSNAAPGSPIDLIKSAGDITPEAEHALMVQYGLDKPVVVRYFIWLGNMGRPYAVQRGVGRLLQPAGFWSDL